MNKNTINIIINLFRIKVGLDKSNNMIDNYISMSKENNLNDIQRDGYKKYHNIIEKELEELRLEIQTIIEKEITKNESIIMDYGCGTGRYIKNFQKKAKVIGFDTNEHILQTVTKKKIPNGLFYKLDFNNKTKFNDFLNKNNNKSDVFLLIEIIQILPRSEINNFISRVRKLMKNNSILIIVYPVPNILFDKYKNLGFYKYSTKELKKILIKNSFKILISKETKLNKQNKKYLKTKQDSKHMMVARKC